MAENKDGNVTPGANNTERGVKNPTGGGNSRIWSSPTKFAASAKGTQPHTKTDDASDNDSKSDKDSKKSSKKS